jgi:hypothetical protein
MPGLGFGVQASSLVPSQSELATACAFCDFLDGSTSVWQVSLRLLLSSLYHRRHPPCPSWSLCFDPLTVAGALPSTKTPQSRAGAGRSSPTSSRVALSRERIFWMKGPGGMSKSVASAQCVASKRCRRFLSSSSSSNSSTRKAREARSPRRAACAWHVLLLQAHGSAEDSDPRCLRPGCPVAPDCYREPAGPWWRWTWHARWPSKRAAARAA